MKKFTQSTPTHSFKKRKKKKKKVHSQLTKNSDGRIKCDGLVHFRGLVGEKKKRKKRKNLVEKCGIIDYETIPTIVFVNQT